MSHQCLADAFAYVEAKYQEDVMRATWGHLAPIKHTVYPGTFTIAIGLFGDDELNPTVIQCEFNNLEDSPWFYDAITEFIGKYQGRYWKAEHLHNRFKCGCVYRWSGTFTNYRFRGRFKRLELRGTK